MATQNARRLLKALWKRACRYDGVTTAGRGRHRYDDCRFVVFSDDNPYEVRSTKVMRLVDAAGRHPITGYRYVDGPIEGVYRFRGSDGRVFSFVRADQCAFPTEGMWGFLYRGHKLVPSV